MDTKHTPWCVDRRPSDIEGVLDTFVVGQSGFDIARVYHQDVDQDTARLIAAAPELYAALDRLLRVCDVVPWPGPYRADLVAALGNARAVLAKVTP